ncbi:hypothetical protein BXZ70DRAFT_951043 [Cristinia sonorae]|uniref:UBA domain-containing protein n=1 Tax=Cristinia sonorae TaxID=1940300 RepID=A0A8K0UIQ9_9AGAR|nr:hypothetical protein BXZ70DRAFT_951043 [Cristinia sonorae]
MADSFADLWNSSAPVKPAEPPKKLGALSANSTGSSSTRKPANDVFSLLANTSTPTSRSVTPSYLATPQSIPPSRSTVVPVQKSVSSGGDAFSGLFAGGSSSGNASQANMTIAQRAAMVERQRSEQLLQRQKATQQAASAWDGLDTLGKSSLSSTNGASSSKNDDDWGFDFASPAPQKQPARSNPTPKAAVVLDDDWGLGDFGSKPASAKATPPPSQKAATGSLWDLDDFASPSSQNGRKPSPEPSIHRSGTPGDFDFGDREDGLLNDRSDDEDDILGDLSKPIDQVRASKPPSHSSSPQPPASGQRSRAVSPPPHIIGQIVEMGFSPQQARVALASTETGLDVQAALETLIANGAASDAASSSRPPPRNREPEGARRRLTDEDENVIPPRRRQPGAAPPRGREHDTPSPAGGESQVNLQEQADKLLAQASEIGLSVFNRAGALWKQGREKVQQAYEEQKAVRGGGSATGVKDGRPKWMQEAAERSGGRGDDGWGESPQDGGFRDGDHDDPVLPPRPTERKAQPTRQEAGLSNGSKTGDLLSADEPTAYVSPWRRKAPSRAEILSKSTTPAAPTPARNPSPIPLIQRKTISATPSAMAVSAKHKATGSEKFKLGQYAEAETSYSTAISALPDSHLLLVPLYNNRALTRIKTGDHSGAIEDCTTVITLIGASYHPAREAKVTKEDEGASVDLADGLVKAYRRRAEAYEGKEKWDAARQDWELIAGAEWAGKVRSEAVRGAGRCRRMVTATAEGNTDAPAAPKPKPTAIPARPKSKPKPVQRGPTPPSEALNRVREANQAAEAEDQMKHELKDTIDAKLAAWKNGKETNIRALIASLDTVLWPELGWQKVGMHELISPNQVKIRYTKAIAKLHPDKLNVNNTTLEQRMIANGVFGSLNEAWNAFKP